MNHEARLAAARIQAADFSDYNGVDMFKAASGGYGRAKQQELLNDIRTLYAHVLGTRPGSGPATPFGDTAA